MNEEINPIELEDDALENISGGVSEEAFRELTPGTRIIIIHGPHEGKYATIMEPPRTGRAPSAWIRLDDGTETHITPFEFELA